MPVGSADGSERLTLGLWFVNSIELVRWVEPMSSKFPASPVTGADPVNQRLYQHVARELAAAIASGLYGIGDRLPAERELAIEFDVSRPTVREAIIALEAQGMVEVRVGSGAYVRETTRAAQPIGFGITAFEVIEARLLLEGEAAALAATHITDEELDRLAQLVTEIAKGHAAEDMGEGADREFHLGIARATRNAAVVQMVDNLWTLRSSSPDCAILHAKARAARVKPIVEEHRTIVEALQTRDPAQGRAAMRAHLRSVLDQLLFATEEQAVEAARQQTASTRARYERSAAL